ncbi:MAG: penicillin-binding transpeptidase domain-containing protein [Bacteroidota bacterium]
MNERAIVIRAAVLVITFILIVRLFAIQVVTDDYKLAAENNFRREIIQYPYRGLMYDRKGALITHNDPIYNLMVIPREVDLEDSTVVIDALSLAPGDYTERYASARRFSRSKPSIFERQISPTLFAQIQDELSRLEGYYFEARTYRAYDHNSFGNALGYVGEISGRALRRDTTNYYRQGDYVGISGIEQEYEQVLRGKRGVSIKMVNARGSVEGDFRGGEFDTVPVPGQDLQLTVDLELQRYAEVLMEGKVGSVVALDPSTGEVLVFHSSPNYDPSLLSGREFSDNFLQLQRDTLKPLFNRPIQARYPPGSMFKTLQALIAMQEGVLGPTEQIYSDLTLIGDLAPAGYYDVIKAIQKSSNNYFYKVYRRVIMQGDHPNAFVDSRIGLEKWKAYCHQFGLGVPLGIDLPNENSGNIPSVATYDKLYGANRWQFSNFYSVSIGQGEVQVTPLQMANLGAIMANRGFFYTPHFVRQIGNDSLVNYERRIVGVDSSYFNVVVDGMEQVVAAGSGRRGFMRDIAICGKTSTVENPPYPDHSGFMGFAPKEDPQISIAVYVENAGQGGRAAASVASLLIEKYVRGEVTRPWLEEYVFRGEFF